MKEGGFWLDNQTEQPVELSSLEKRLKGEAEKRKSLITPERIERTLQTEDLRGSFNTLSAATMSLYNLAKLEKQQNVLEIRERSISNEEIMRHYPTIYIGAGLDVEYPLCLGARNIVTVDPILKDASYIERLRVKMRALSGQEFTEDDNHFYFKFDFGQGKEDVVITMDSRIYTGKENTSVQEFERFVPPSRVGGILVFQGEDPSQNNETVENLLPGGLILSNRWLEKIVTEYFDEHPEQREIFGEATPSEKRKILENFYRAKGFTSIQLESFEDNAFQTLLRKEEIPARIGI